MQGVLIISIGIYKISIYFSYYPISLPFCTYSKYCHQISGILHFMDAIEMEMITAVMEWNEFFI